MCGKGGGSVWGDLDICFSKTSLDHPFQLFNARNNGNSSHSLNLAPLPVLSSSHTHTSQLTRPHLVSISRASSSAFDEKRPSSSFALALPLTRRRSSFLHSAFLLDTFFMSGVSSAITMTTPRPVGLASSAALFLHDLTFFSFLTLSMATNTCLSQLFSLARTQAYAHDNQSQTRFPQRIFMPKTRLRTVMRCMVYLQPSLTTNNAGLRIYNVDANALDFSERSISFPPRRLSNG